ncbi:type I glyceraldehyde-3-phosphate dehydrogenase [Herbaspirillum sp. VT-16-41]|uniref:type I glyceraldehyde-3-phosphate dehydrogenase n=1 Tax=Herbaspirillum sp. VT-16-41 TaxID=1953765 RepID=UPI00098153B8|nr:type I glyceraldehyde-3-phosphate dehydrogenase [Herbaspirillum sp. VT-16-41]ONN65039.1 type I glyceraldehyde-3-phosphate dehydrogenase [Herbaspirillum sp. VT-16-41]
MSIRVAINGYGRIGRNALRAAYESGRRDDLEIVAINDLGSAEINAHLTRFDTTHGKFSGRVDVDGNTMVVEDDRIAVLSERDPTRLPWAAMEVDVVLECTGRFANRQLASAHLTAGARRVLISAPAGKDVDATIVYGVNHDTLKPQDRVVAIGSCTTNCLGVVAKPLHDHIGIVAGSMTTIHAVTNDQVLTDVYHEDMRRARSALTSMIPTKTGAASTIGLVLPELDGRLDGFSIRVPTLDVCLLVLSFSAARETSVQEVNAVMRDAASMGPLAGILKTNVLPLVSTDFLHDDASATLDLSLTKVVGGTHVTVHAWYDNEWGFANRLLDNAIAFGALPY